MNDERNPDSPVVPEQAPDHGPDFWNRLDAALDADATRTSSQTSTMAAVTSGSSSAGGNSALADATSQMPRLTAVDGTGAGAGAPAQRRSPSRWPLAAAAVAIVVVGLGLLVARGAGDPATTTEIVAAPTAVADAAAADGSGDGSGDVQNTSPTAVPPTNDADTDDTEGATPDPDSVEVAASEPAQADSDDAAAPRPTPAPIPDFDAARGAVGDPDFLPLDQGIPADGTFLANWPERRLTWYAVTDPAANCASPNYSELRYVNASGITQQVRDPQLRFSGEISHFVVRAEQNLAAWIVACGEQLELYVATLDSTGQIIAPTLVWLGQGSTSSALVLWEQDEVSLNAIEPGGDAFSVDYNIETGLLSRNGGPSRIMLEAGAPAERSLTPLAASPDGGLTYWQGQAEPGTVSACAELFGSGRSDMLWLRQGEGQWQPAVAGDFPVGTVTAAALDSTALQFAFADVCAGESGRVVVGTQLPDGRIGGAAEIDLTPFVPGFAAQLFWIDDTTLRIETDNSEFGFGVVRFDYRLDEGLMVQLD